MKKLLLVYLFLWFVLAFAKPMIPGFTAFADDITSYRPEQTEKRQVPQYVFSQLPDTLCTTSYDYMIGGYNNLPLVSVPANLGGGYFVAFHDRSFPNGSRGIHWAYIPNNGGQIHSAMIPSYTNAGYPAIALDQEGGNPFYVWHVNADEDADLEVMFAYDRMLAGVPGNLTEPVIIIDNPVTIGDTDDNQFIQAEICIGPSPNPGMRRVYVIGKNRSSHSISGLPSENILLLYADFNTQMLEYGNQLAWNSMTIPQLDDWNNDITMNRRPFLSLSADLLGNVYLIGYHIAIGLDDEWIHEPELDVFVGSNYAEGQWSYHNFDSSLACWNPVYDSPWHEGFFTDEDGNGISDEDLNWMIANSNHFNAVVDHNGRVRAIGLWPLMFNNSYYTSLHTVKSYTYDPGDNSMCIRDVYPLGNPENGDYPHYIPWDTEPPWGEVDNWIEIDGEFYPQFETLFPFAYWDETAVDGAMMFQYNHLKLSKVNNENMMVAVWQDTDRARHAWLEPDQFPDAVAYQQSPEIVIVTSADGGNSWSDPIFLNDVDNPELAGIRPMYVYPADLVKFVGMQGTQKVGRLGLLLLDDNEWGAGNIFNPHVMPDSCMVMFTELEIVFPEPVANDDPHLITPALSLIKNAYPNPFRENLNIGIEVKQGAYELKVFNIKGQCVYETQGTGKGEMNLNWNGCDSRGKQLPSGIYLMQLKTDINRSTRKVLKY